MCALSFTSLLVAMTGLHLVFSAPSPSVVPIPPRWTVHNDHSYNSTRHFSTETAIPDTNSLFRDLINPYRSVCPTGMWLGTYSSAQIGSILTYKRISEVECYDAPEGDILPPVAIRPIGDPSDIHGSSITLFTDLKYEPNTNGQLITQDIPALDITFQSFILLGDRNIQFYFEQNYVGSSLCVQTDQLWNSVEVKATAITDIQRILGVAPGTVKSIKFINADCPPNPNIILPKFTEYNGRLPLIVSK